MAGSCYFSAWYGSKVIKLNSGITAIQVNKREDLPDAIRCVMEAVKQGELYIQLEDAAEKGSAELRFKVGNRQVKRAV